MKISEFKRFIKEEIQSILKEEAPKPRYKKGEKFAYRGIGYTVVSDDGYVVKAVDKNGKEAMLNHNQLNQGVYKKPDFLKEEDKMKEYTFGYFFFSGEDEEDYDEVTVTASNEKEARELAYKAAKRENSAIKTSGPEKMSLVK